MSIERQTNSRWLLGPSGKLAEADKARADKARADLKARADKRLAEKARADSKAENDARFFREYREKATKESYRDQQLNSWKRPDDDAGERKPGDEHCYDAYKRMLREAGD